MAIGDDDIAQIRQALTDQGMTQKQLAEQMNLPQSAISNLLTGKRSLKAREASQLRKILNLGNVRDSDWEPMPFLKLEEIDDYLKNGAFGRSFERDLDRPKGTALFAFDYHLPKLSVPAFRHMTIIVNPLEKRLFSESGYLLKIDEKFGVWSYRNEPARFESFWDPSWDAPIYLGVDGILNYGHVQKIQWESNFENRIDG